MQHADRSLCLLRYRRSRRADANTVSCAQSCTWQQTTTRIARSWSASRLAGRNTALLDRGRALAAASASPRRRSVRHTRRLAKPLRPELAEQLIPARQRVSRGAKRKTRPRSPGRPPSPGGCLVLRGGVLMATGNLKDSTELEVTGDEPADRDAVPAEQLSVRCALGPQAKRSPGGAGARNAIS